ncbi:MAG: hypothetical protein H6732_12785 [Alphaproteobacteria bacterium]|nr:hypothetical protein [Alphaproteobacteria bacterium]
MRHLPLTLLLAACSGEISLGGLDSDVDTDADGQADDTDPADSPAPTDTGKDDTAEDDTGEPAPVIDPRFDEAVLVVAEPVPAGVYLLDEGIPLEGWVESADGVKLPAGDLHWTTTGEDFWGLEGAFDVEAGRYDVEVGADLPNGDRLRTTIGGVRVQDDLTGVYAGSVQIAAFFTYQGQEIRSDCIGALAFHIGAGGKQVNGSGGCQLSVFFTDPIDFTFDLTGTIDKPDVSGALRVNALLIKLPIPWEGTVTTKNGLQGGFAADLTVARFEGSLSARRVSTLLP